jgi:hypothetical protein
MKKCLVLSFVLFSVCKINAQQNLFNIPSGDVTPKKEFFYQHQLNLYAINELETKSHVVYGVGRNWDVGINFIDLPLRIGNGSLLSYNDNSTRKPLYPLLVATAQKQWDLAKKLQLNTGTQIGINLSSDVDNKKLAFMNYALLKWKGGRRGYLIGGPYLSNDVFVGGPSLLQPGYMFGYEYKVSRRWLLMGDFISGNHKKSQSVLGAGYNLSNRLQVFAGALLRFPNRNLQDGLVVEINWYGWNFQDKH